MLKILIAIVGTLARLHAAPICLIRREAITGPLEVARYLTKVNVYGESDRRTAREFAKENRMTPDEVANRFAASGDLQCGTSSSQAQLVVTSDRVLVAHHGLPGSPCVDEKSLSRCKVTFNEAGRLKEYGLDKMIAGGMTCKTGFMNMRSEDWAVIKLKGTVDPKIKPYQVRDAPCASNSKPIDVVAVGKSKDYGPAPSRVWTSWTKHYANCRLRLGNCGERFPILRSDCDTSGGSSGGGMFEGSNEPKLMGIVQGAEEGCNNSNPDHIGAYDQNCWNSVYVPITKELRAILERPNGSENDKPESAPKRPKQPPSDRSFQDL